MRHFLTSLLLLATACNGNGVPVTNEGAFVQLQARVGTLEGEVSDLRGQLQQAQAVLASLQAGGAGKVAHLVVEATGEDLGVYLGGPIGGGTSAWSVTAGGELDFAKPTAIIFDGPECTGNSYLDATRFYRSSQRGMLVNGHVWKPANTDIVQHHRLSTLTDVCRPSVDLDDILSGVLAVSTGVALTLYTQDQLIVRLQ